MCVRIGVEDLAANALIELLKKSDKSRFVSYNAMERYGLAVARLLRKEDEEVIIYSSRLHTSEMLVNYSDYFEECIVNGEYGIRLCDEKSIEDLRIKFRGYLALKVLLAFVNEQSVKALGVG